nr:immunoglobulin heavy chain junction region [Macaca mulatta]MOV47878.1 immunoglobulin heavy chain junction region [Macaca mulatta]MOV48459.1 immunoglobulin heavy chain junction region [Macaca mulatta]MOV48658.1 immunoglobulin heavy chain junction region [Macaca mulatta]
CVNSGIAAAGSEYW